MKLQIENIEDIAKCVYDGELPYNTSVSVPAGYEVLHLCGGELVSVVREGTSVINSAGFLKSLTRCKKNSRLFVVSRARQFSVLWGTGGIGFYDKKGNLRLAGANGTYQFAVDNAQALLRKFGYADIITAETVKNHMKGMVTGVVKEQVLAAIDKGGYNVGGKTGEIQQHVQARLEKVFADYGLFLDVILIDEVSDTYEGQDGKE